MKMISDKDRNFTLHYERQVFPNLTGYEKSTSLRSSTTDNSSQNMQVFASNKTRTSLYTKWDLFPKAFALQFTKLANVYWAISSCLQFYKPIQTANPILVVFFVLVVVLIGVFKELNSDIKRQRADNQVNNSLFQKVTEMKNLKQTNDE